MNIKRVILALLLLASMFAFAQEPKTGGTVIVATDRIPTNLHPGRSTALPDLALNMLIYDGLIITGPDGSFHPMLAHSWEGSDDGLTWTFHLRDDVTFHSGNPLTAYDVKTHFDMWQNDFPTRAKLASLDSTEIVDDHTVRFHLKTPNLVFLSMISQTEWGYGGIPEAAAVAEWGDDYGIVPASISGTGPFRMVEWTRDQQAVLERNPDYAWGAPFYENTGPVHVDRLIYRSIPEGAARSAALELGEIHVDIAVNLQDAERIASLPGINVLRQSRTSINQIVFNHDKEMFQDERVRRAITHAINQQDLVDGAWYGYAELATGMWHNSIDGATPDDEIAPFMADYDPERAAELLDEAGWTVGSGGIREKDGQRMAPTMWVYTDISERVAVIVQAYLRQVGIDLSIRRVEQAAWNDTMAAGGHDMAYVDGSHTTADISYWYTEAALPTPNRTKWVDPRTEELYALSQTTTDPAERTRAFQEIEQILVGESVMIPLPHHQWLVGSRDNVHGLTFDAVHGLFKFQDIWVD